MLTADKKEVFVTDSVLIISGSQQSVPALISMLNSEGFSEAYTVDSAGEAKRVCGERKYSLIIINSPLSDDKGYELAVYLLKNTGSCVIVIVRNELEDKTERELLPYGAFVLGKPLNKTVFHKTLCFAKAAQNRVKSLQKENVKLREQAADNKIITRAKYILMEYLSMSEAQAHRYIEKQAMDLRLTKLEIAKNLLSTYDS